MKFKSIFIILCSILLILIAFLIALPYLIHGPSFSASIWRVNWPIILIFFLFFLAFVLFYITNWRLFRLLENEDWPALARYLEDKVIRKGNYSPRLVRLLANTYLVLSDSAAVMSLENKVAAAKPALVDANAMVFGTARILGGDIPGAVRFFEKKKDTVKSDRKEWALWYHGFSLLMDRRFEEAGSEFSSLAQISKDGVITGLSSFFLSENIARILPDQNEELLKISSDGRERVRKAMPAITDWTKEVRKLFSEIHVAAISRYIEETGRWIYS